jgi:hypothetical protein
MLALLETVILLRLLHKVNAILSIEATLEGMVTLVRLVHIPKAPCPI